MDLKIAGRHALVFGASKGLGRAVAQELIAEGARVVIVSRDPARIAATASEIGAIGIAGDVASPGSCGTLIEQATKALGAPVDILVTNTGGPPAGPFERMSSADWQKGFDNLWISTVESVRAVLPHMRQQQWGRILAITSIAAREPQPGLVISNSLRAGLLGLINSLSRDIAKDGITINALLPGYTATDRVKELGLDDATMGPKIPAGRMGRPEEFAALAAFLASDRASYITGQAIAVDGGFLNSI
ncbi:SDR family oxidoreductase [Steroidobacter sp. S1-65]|uniref:SDR family oxidoreductase n=1 Tax=Steroidobacter gossypii TaxID=2805490 RepID=A0ABS1X134_9GAMM|nr:SDR family oxidoreductase [Steroidobacter gossypii]MBM0106922.1 SDR family oxidoreductase [Steroidobacter gossypii]